MNRKILNRRLAVEFNPPWNLIANRGEIRQKQNLARGEAALFFSVNPAFASNPARAGFCVKIGYNELESGTNPNPTIDTLIKIANALGVGVDDLIK